MSSTKTVGKRIYEQMQLFGVVSDHCGSLAIVHLPRWSVKWVDCINRVCVIETGPHRDELIYVRRVFRTDPADGVGYPAYPLVHARADGREIREISDEGTAGDFEAPLLEAYLRKIGGTITVDGRRLPSR